MAKKGRVLSASIDVARAMALVASLSNGQRRDFRLVLGKITRLSDLDDEQLCFFYGECMVFSQVSEDINEWIRTNFVEKGGTPNNYIRLKELYEFYLALSSDVDIRYRLESLDSGDYDIKDASIAANDFYIPSIR